MSKIKQLQNFIRTNRYVKAIPNALTLCNSLCGFAAIVYTLQAYNNRTEQDALTVFAISAVIIIFAMVFDAMDGVAARLFNAASMHGIQMDSLADMVTFGVAPATIAAVMTHWLRDEMADWQSIMTYSLSGIYLGCVALRLATYNVHAILEKKSSDKFSGLPSPGGAAALCSIVLLFFWWEWPQSHLGFILPCYAFVLGLLMVSPISYPHMGKWLFTVRHHRKRLIAVLLTALLVCLFPVHMTVILVNLYVLSGPGKALFRLLKNSRKIN